MHSFSKFDRTTSKCLAEFRKRNFSGDHLSKVMDAAYAFEEARYSMSLDAPHDPIIAAALKDVNRNLQALSGVFVIWNKASEGKDRKALDREHWIQEHDSAKAQFAKAREFIFQAMRDDLHREVGEDFAHGPVRYSFKVKRAKRKMQRAPSPLSVSDDQA
ncbi:hypothetical protein [Streptomyces sp. NPDC055400]